MAQATRQEPPRRPCSSLIPLGLICRWPPAPVVTAQVLGSDPLTRSRHSRPGEQGARTPTPTRGPHRTSTEVTSNTADTGRCSSGR